MNSGETNGSASLSRVHGISRFLFSTPAGRTFIRIALSILIVGFVINITKFILRGHRDLEIFFFAAQQLSAGGDIYAVEAPSGGFYIYPPLFAFLLIPFTALPAWTSTLIWTIMNVVCVWAIIRSLFRAITGRRIAELEFKERLTIFALALLPSADFLISNMRNGQANVIVLAMTVGALGLYRRDRQASSGVVIGLAAVLKVFSLPLGFWMFLQRKTSVMAGIIFGIGLGISLPAVVSGWRANQANISHWLTQILAKRDIRDHFVPFDFNTSYEAILFKLFSDVPAFTYDNLQYSVAIVSIDERLIRAAGILMILITLSLVVVYWRRFRNGNRIAIEAGGPILTMLIAPLLTPLTEKYHLVFVLPAYLYIVVLNRCFGVSDRLFIGMGLLSFALGTLSLKLFWGDYFSKLWFAHGCMILCVLFLIGAVFRAGKLLENDTATIDSVGLASGEPCGKIRILSAVN